MDSKNVIAAISLSAAVIILYSLFFAPSPEKLKIKDSEQEQIQKTSDTPSLRNLLEKMPLQKTRELNLKMTV